MKWTEDQIKLGNSSAHRNIKKKSPYGVCCQTQVKDPLPLLTARAKGSFAWRCRILIVRDDALARCARSLRSLALAVAYWMYSKVLIHRTI